jgi:hypothetical protein
VPILNDHTEPEHESGRRLLAEISAQRRWYSARAQRLSLIKLILSTTHIATLSLALMAAFSPWPIWIVQIAIILATVAYAALMVLSPNLQIEALRVAARQIAQIEQQFLLELVEDNQNPDAFAYAFKSFQAAVEDIQGGYARNSSLNRTQKNAAAHDAG